MTIKGSGKVLNPLDRLALKARVFRSIKMITHTASNISVQAFLEKSSAKVYSSLNVILRFGGGKKSMLDDLV